MSDVKLTLNIRTPPASNGALSKAAAKKASAIETLDEAWVRILAMKNSDSDNVKLAAVKRAMADGKLGRAPATVGKRFSKAEALRMYTELAEQEREGKLADLVENTPENYVLVDSVALLNEVIEQCRREPIIAVDTETTGLDIYVDVIVGISITTPSTDTHYYIPIKPTEDNRALPLADVMEPIRSIMEDANIEKVLHNASYDINMFKRHGVGFEGLAWDTLPAMALLNENEPSFALKNLATRYLGEPSDTFAELFGKHAKFAEVPLDVALVYAAKDTHLTWRLYEFQLEHLSKMPEVLRYYREVELPLIHAVIDMERTGFDIDVEYAKEYGEEMSKDIARLDAELKAEVGDININSPVQLKASLEMIVGKSLESTDAKRVLKPLSREFPTIAKLLEYKELTKLYSTYISVLPEKIHPVTGKLHARFNANGTVTGRFSSGGNGVNLQNQPYAARKLFVAPPGYVIVGADFSAQEIRCAAYYTGEPALVEAFANGRDPYATLAAEYYGKPYEQCYKTADDKDTPERKAMKVGMLASLYGTGPGTLAQQLGGTLQEAKDFLETFFKRYSNIKRWIDETQAEAERQGFVWMDGKQRKRRLPDAKLKTKKWNDPKRGDKMRAMRQGPNARIQGTSAIQTKVTLVNLHKACKERGWLLWATIHDEVLVAMPTTFTQEDITEFERIMVESYQFGDIRNKTDIEVAARWGEGISVEEYFAKNSEPHRSQTI